MSELTWFAPVNFEFPRCRFVTYEYRVTAGKKMQKKVI